MKIKPVLCFCHSITIPEKLEYFINKYAEHSHDKWSMDKVTPDGHPLVQSRAHGLVTAPVLAVTGLFRPGEPFS